MGLAIKCEGIQLGSRNQRYLMAFWFTVIINCVILDMIYTSEGL